MEKATPQLANSMAKKREKELKAQKPHSLSRMLAKCCISITFFPFISTIIHAMVYLTMGSLSFPLSSSCLCACLGYMLRRMSSFSSLFWNFPTYSMSTRCQNSRLFSRKQNKKKCIYRKIVSEIFASIQLSVQFYFCILSKRRVSSIRETDVVQIVHLAMFIFPFHPMPCIHLWHGECLTR